MKLRTTGWLIVVSLAFLPTASGQDFQDLNFESATLVLVPGDAYGGVQFAPAFPGWTVTIVGAIDTNALYNNIFLDSAGIAIIDHTSPYSGKVIEGDYTAVLQSGLGYTASGPIPANVTLSQTGIILAGTKSLQFKANEWFDASGSFAVTLGGQTLSLTALGTGSNYTLYGADVSQWAGQTAQLAFTVFGENPHVNDETLFLDAIQFSTQSIPEPGNFALSVLAGLFFGLRRLKQTTS